MGTETPDMLEDNEYPNVRTSAGTSASELNDLLACKKCGAKEPDIEPWFNYCPVCGYHLAAG